MHSAGRWRQLTETNYLLDAIQKLTTVHKSKVMQSRTLENRNLDGEVVATHEVTYVTDVFHDPLLVTLRDAIVGGIGSHVGSSPARERIPLDPGALALFDEISAHINRWYRALDAFRFHEHIHDRLAAWYIDFENRRRAGIISDADETITTNLVEGWARRIEAMFDPPKTIELTSGDAPVPCPVCGGQYAIDPRSGDRMTALVIEYREVGQDTMDQATGLCRSCSAVWRGSTGVRQLRWLVDEGEVPEMQTIQGYTVDQIRSGLRSALADHNTKGAASLLSMLASLDPEGAQQVREIIEALDNLDGTRRRIDEQRARLYRQITVPAGEPNHA